MSEDELLKLIEPTWSYIETEVLTLPFLVQFIAIGAGYVVARFFRPRLVEAVTSLSQKSASILLSRV